MKVPPILGTSHMNVAQRLTVPPKTLRTRLYLVHLAISHLQEGFSGLGERAQRARYLAQRRCMPPPRTRTRLKRTHLLPRRAIPQGLRAEVRRRAGRLPYRRRLPLARRPPNLAQRRTVPPPRMRTRLKRVQRLPLLGALRRAMAHSPCMSAFLLLVIFLTDRKCSLLSNIRFLHHGAQVCPQRVSRSFRSCHLFGHRFRLIRRSSFLLGEE